MKMLLLPFPAPLSRDGHTGEGVGCEEEGMRFLKSGF
jgi:hypothetical protein